jgi:integrase/recombinase XerD
MLVELFPRKHRQYSSLPVLGPILGDFVRWLIARGYPPTPVRRHVRAARRLEQRWHRRGVRTLGSICRNDFQVCAPGHSQDDAYLAAVARLLPRYLEEIGVLSRQADPPEAPELAGYRWHLESLRGLAPSTITHHLFTAGELLRWLRDKTPVGDLAGLTPTDIDAFLQQISPRFSRASLQHTVAHLRSFLRFLAAQDRAQRGLDRHIDTPRVYRQEQLPRTLPWESVRALLESIDRTTALGRRDYAMLLLIATYGLRTSEVVALTLDDIAWRRDELHVPRRKVDGVLLLPLTTDVGAALLDYIRRGRPSHPTRVVFLRVRPPAGVLKATAVTEVFQARARRSGLGIPFQGPHCLRHSLAVRLLREGVSLKAIGDVLGHRGVESTCLYLRLATEDLRDVALGVPGNSAASTEKVRA